MSIKVIDPNIQRCLKCNGNVATKQDIYGDYLTCLMCGTTSPQFLQPPPKKTVRTRAIRRQKVSA